ncbi:MAG: hypothetical protein U0841_31335 [Chloroflexia bacterium]
MPRHAQLRPDLAAPGLPRHRRRRGHCFARRGSAVGADCGAEGVGLRRETLRYARPDAGRGQGGARGA